MAKDKKDEVTKPLDVEGTKPPLIDPPAWDQLPGPDRHPFEDVTMRDAWAALALMQMEIRGMEAEGVAVRCFEIADHMMLQRLK